MALRIASSLALVLCLTLAGVLAERSAAAAPAAVETNGKTGSMQPIRLTIDDRDENAQLDMERAFTADIGFRSGSNRLSPIGRETVTKLARRLSGPGVEPARYVILASTEDWAPKGGFDRAQSIRGALIEERIPEAMLVVSGWQSKTTDPGLLSILSSPGRIVFAPIVFPASTPDRGRVAAIESANSRLTMAEATAAQVASEPPAAPSPAKPAPAPPPVPARLPPPAPPPVVAVVPPRVVVAVPPPPPPPPPVAVAPPPVVAAPPPVVTAPPPVVAIVPPPPPPPPAPPPPPPVVAALPPPVVAAPPPVVAAAPPPVVAAVPPPPVAPPTVAPPPKPAPPPAPVAAAGDKPKDCSVCPPLVVVAAGTFQMGGEGNDPYERPRHKVTIAKAFAIGIDEVTFEQWDQCVAAGACRFNPDDHGWGRGNRPLIGVSWNDAQEYIAWLIQLTGQRYRLPTEAEWEYAARAGTSTPFWWGKDASAGRANCTNCGGTHPATQTTPVGSFPANAFGLADTAGNAAEWVEDCWHDSHKGAPADGSAWVSGPCREHVLRGGSFVSDAKYVRSASRFKYDTDVRYYANGFRVARDLR